MSITVFGSYKSVLKKYTDFNGRLSRRGYWYFVLANIIVSYSIAAIIFVIENVSIELNGTYNGLTSEASQYLYMIALFIPGLAAGVRRLHDTNRSGWYYLLLFIPLIGGIVLLIFLLERGNQQSNDYGPVPRE
jgi:uncharacterized membrane protein YhaH (DUF805 family)